MQTAGVPFGRRPIDQVREFLRRAGTRPRKRLSQNFLVDAAALRAIADAVPRTVGRVIEIGAGAGALTRELARAGFEVTAIELDRALVGALRDELADTPAVEVVEADALRFDFSGRTREAPIAVVGNLPYGIATALLERLLDVKPPPVAIIAMFQREVARRLVARPRTKAYGPLTLLVGATATVEVLLELAPAAFLPRPEVYSTVVRITPLAIPRVPVERWAAFRSAVRAAFAKRRKMLRNSFPAAVLDAAQIDGTRRAEELTIDDFLALSGG